jgi:hypothetical protein
MTMLPESKEEQALDIFNQLAGLDIGDVEDAVRLLFRIRTLDTGYPDLIIKLSRADAALIAGYRQEAVESLDYAYQLRGSTSDLASLQRLQLLLLLSGQIQRAIETARLLINTPGSMNEYFIFNLVITALWAGDLVLLNEIAQKEKKTGDSVAAKALELLAKAGIDSVISEHQRIVRDVLQDYQICIGSSVNEADEIEASLINVCYFDGTQTDRKALERQLDNALDANYRQNGINESAWRGRIITIITEAPRHAGVDLAVGRAAAA